MTDADLCQWMLWVTPAGDEIKYNKNTTPAHKILQKNENKITIYYESTPHVIMSIQIWKLDSKIKELDRVDHAQLYCKSVQNQQRKNNPHWQHGIKKHVDVSIPLQPSVEWPGCRGTVWGEGGPHGHAMTCKMELGEILKQACTGLLWRLKKKNNSI